MGDFPEDFVSDLEEEEFPDSFVADTALATRARRLSEETPDILARQRQELLEQFIALVPGENPEMDEIRDGIRNAIQEADDPEKEEQKVVDSFFSAEVFRQEVNQAYLDMDAKLEALNRRIVAPPSMGPGEAFTKAFRQSLSTTPAAVVSGFRAFTPGGKRVDPLLQKASNYLLNLRDEQETEELAPFLGGRLWPIHEGQDWRAIEPELIPQVVTNWGALVGDQIPILLVTGGGKFTGWAIGTGVAALVGLATWGPEPSDAVVVPFIAENVAALVGHIGGAGAMVAMEAGNFMDQATDLGIDIDIMERHARDYGMAAGIIEYAQQVWNFGALKSLGNIPITALKNTDKTAGKIVAFAIKEVTGNVFEGAEEFSQAYMFNAAMNSAIQEQLERERAIRGVTGEPQLLDEEKSQKEILLESRIVEDLTEGGGREFLVGFGIGFVLRAPGHIAKGVLNQLPQSAKDRLKANDASLQAKVEKEIEREAPVRPEVSQEVSAEVTQLINEYYEEQLRAGKITKSQLGTPEVQKRAVEAVREQLATGVTEKVVVATETQEGADTIFKLALDDMVDNLDFTEEQAQLPQNQLVALANAMDIASQITALSPAALKEMGLKGTADEQAQIQAELQDRIDALRTGKASELAIGKPVAPDVTQNAKIMANTFIKEAERKPDEEAVEFLDKVYGHVSKTKEITNEKVRGEILKVIEYRRELKSLEIEARARLAAVPEEQRAFLDYLEAQAEFAEATLGTTGLTPSEFRERQNVAIAKFELVEKKKKEAKVKKKVAVAQEAKIKEEIEKSNELGDDWQWFDVENLARNLRDRAVDEYEATVNHPRFDEIIDRGKIKSESLEQTQLESMADWVRKKTIAKNAQETIDEMAQDLGMAYADDLVEWLLSFPETEKPARNYKAYLWEAWHEYGGESLGGGKTRIRDRLHIARGVRDALIRFNLLKGADTWEDITKQIESIDRAIKDANKLIAQAEREGRKEGKAKAEARRRELNRKTAELKAIRAHYTKLGNSIARKIAKNTDFYYKEAIVKLQAGIDPKFRAKRTLEQREATKKMVEENPEYAKTLTPEVVALSFAKAFNDMTIEEVEAYEAQVTRLRQEGRRVFQAKDQAFKGENEVRLKKMEEEGLRGGKLEVVEELQGSPKLEWGKYFRQIGLRPTRWLQTLSGGGRNTLFREFYEKPNEATNVELGSWGKRVDDVHAKMKKIGLKPEDVYKTALKITDEQSGKVYRYSIQQAALVYWGMKNDRMALALEFGQKIKPERIEKIIDYVEKHPQIKEFGKIIVDDFAKRYPEYREAVINLINEDPGLEEHYITIERQEWDGLPLNEQLIEELGLRKAYFRAGVDKSATHKRLDIKPEHQKRININLYDVWLRNSEKQEHLIAMGEHIKRLNAYLADNNLKNMIVQKYGRHSLKDLEFYVSKIANPQVWRKFSEAEKIARWLKKNTAVAYLAYNLVTMAKQVPSVILYMAYADPIQLIYSAVQVAFHPVAVYNFVIKNDQQVARRSFERVLDQLRTAGGTSIQRLQDKVGKAGVAGIFFFDKVAITIGWNASYNKWRSLDHPHAEAVKYAQWATLMTQPQAHVKDLASIYTQNEFLNLFLQFTQQLNQIYNIVTYDIRQFAKEGHGGQAILSAMGVIMAGMTIWMISNRKVPDEPEEWVEALSDQFIAMVPFLGRTMISVKSGYKATLPPALGAIPEAGGRLLRRAQEGEDVSIVDVSTALEALAIGAKMPYTQTKRLIKFISTGDALELIGGQPRE